MPPRSPQVLYEHVEPDLLRITVVSEQGRSITFMQIFTNRTVLQPIVETLTETINKGFENGLGEGYKRIRDMIRITIVEQMTTLKSGLKAVIEEGVEAAITALNSGIKSATQEAIESELQAFASGMVSQAEITESKLNEAVSSQMKEVQSNFKSLECKVGELHNSFDNWINEQKTKRGTSDHNRPELSSTRSQTVKTASSRDAPSESQPLVSGPVSSPLWTDQAPSQSDLIHKGSRPGSDASRAHSVVTDPVPLSLHVAQSPLRTGEAPSQSNRIPKRKFGRR